MKEKLQDYIDGKIKLTPILNILLNYGRSSFSKLFKKDSYELLGEYLYKQYNETESDNETLKKVFVNTKKKTNDQYHFWGIMFTTSLLDLRSMRRMYGDGIKHSHFGEGFDSPKTSYDYISYMITVNGRDYHIGFDHRGTTIECERGIEPKELIMDIEYLIDRYLEIE